MADHGPSHYIKIWKILLVLLVISVLGPELEIKIVTLITAFGIAVVKAYMVAKYFMHVNIERKYVHYILSPQTAIHDEPSQHALGRRAFSINETESN